MKKMVVIGLFALIFSGVGLTARAQPVDPYEDFRDPGENLVVSESSYEDAESLYQDLVRSDRCPEKRLGKRGEPCALIVYPGGEAYRPIFRVLGRKTIWTLLDTKLAEVTLDELWMAHDLSGPSGERMHYPPVGVVGLRECETGNCPHEKHFKTFIEDPKLLTVGCRSAIWGNRADPHDRYLAATCRIYRPHE